VRVKLKDLEVTRSFYIWKLEEEGLTERKRNKYLVALKIIDQHIEEKQNPGKKKNKYLNKTGS